MGSKIALYHKLSLYGVVAVAFGCVFAGAILSVPTMGVFAAVVAGSWGADRTRLTDEAYNKWWNVLIVAVLAGTIALIWTGANTFLRGGVRFVAVLTAIKLTSRSGPRDELQIYALSFLAIAAATAVYTGLSFGLLFGTYVLVGTFSLALFHLRIELANRRRVPLLRTIPFDARYMTVLAVLSVGIFASSLVIFFGFPRIGLGFFAQNSRAGTQMSGFSDSVDLGSHGVIRDNPEIAIRVEFPDGKPSGYSNYHWRMITFDTYDGTGWRRTLSDDDKRFRSSEGTYDLAELYSSRLPDGPPDDRPQRMKMYLEPLDSQLVPVLWPSRKIEFARSIQDSLPSSPRSGSLRHDKYGDIHHTVPSDIGLPYTLYPGRRPDPDELRSIDRRRSTDSRYLEPYFQLPSDTERIRTLAERVTADADTPYAKAEAVAAHLRSNYSYTTDLPQSESGNPVEDFLFSTRRGHCEYYATAMVLMLRTLDIPARMVNGFLGGKWNDVGGYLAVRQGDAHSWVEVYVPGYAWVQIDPTPAGATPPESSALTDWFNESWDALRMVWLQYVIEYDLEMQLDFLKSASRFLSSDGGGTSGDTSNDSSAAVSPWTWISWGGLVLIALGAGWRTRRVHPRFDRRRLVGRILVWGAIGAGWAASIWGMTSLDALFGAGAAWTGVLVGSGWAAWRATRGALPVTRMFRRIDHAGRRAGYGRDDGETPGRYLERLGDVVPGAERQLQLFRHRYHAARFGGRELDARSRRAAAEAARTIVEALSSADRPDDGRSGS